MSGDRSEWLATLRPGDTVTVTHYVSATRGQRYATLTPQHGRVTHVSRTHLMVLGQRFRISWTGGDAGHSTSGPHARLSPAGDLADMHLQARLHRALNILLPLRLSETFTLDSRMERVPHPPGTGVITLEIVEKLERAVAALGTLRAEVEAAAGDIDARADAWWETQKPRR